MSSSTPGFVLDRYKPLALIGPGILGEMHVAIEIATNRKFAIQACQRPTAVTEEAWSYIVARSIKELMAAQSLEHPNIAPIHEFGEERGLFYLLYEWEDTESLGAKLRRGERLPFDDATRLIMRAGFAVQYASNNGVRHGNLSPHCLFVSGDTIRVAGFGLSDWRPADRSIYRAPEEVRGGAGDLRSDIFVLGMVWYEVVQGEHPFQAATAEATREQILHAPTPTPTHTPFYLQPLVRKLLCKDPADRFGSWPEVAMDVSSARPVLKDTEPEPEPEPEPADEPLIQELSMALSDDALDRLDRIKKQRDADRQRQARAGVWANRFRMLRLASAAVPVACVLASCAHRAQENSLVLDHVHGEVRVASAGVLPGRRVGNGYSPRVGDSVLALAGGRAQLRVGDGSRVLEEQQSQFNISEVRFRPRSMTRARVFFLNSGRIYCRVQKRPNLVFIVDSRNGPARAVGTEFSVEIDSLGRTWVTTLQGYVLAGTPPTTLRLGPGQTAILVNGVAYPATLPAGMLALHQREMRLLHDEDLGDALGGLLQAVDDATLLQAGDLFQGATNGVFGPRYQQAAATMRAQQAMQVLYAAMEGTGGEYPASLNPETLAELRPTNDQKAKILGNLKGHRLEYYTRLIDGYEIGARVDDEDGTMIILHNGKVTLNPSAAPGR